MRFSAIGEMVFYLLVFYISGMIAAMTGNFLAGGLAATVLCMISRRIEL